MARRLRALWGAATLLAAAVLFWAATSDVVYDATSPPDLSWHVALRKAYSVGAFALVGFLTTNALPRTARPALRAAVLVAIYSAAIEVVQAFDGSHEGLTWNAVDIACGALGGALGASVARVAQRTGERLPR